MSPVIWYELINLRAFWKCHPFVVVKPSMGELSDEEKERNYSLMSCFIRQNRRGKEMKATLTAKTFTAQDFAIEDVGEGSWFRFEDLASGSLYEMTEIEARELVEWLLDRLDGKKER